MTAVWLVLVLCGTSWVTGALAGAHQCHAEKWSLEQRVERCQSVFTAVIDSMTSSMTNAIDADVLLLTVRVKRVLKGRPALQDRLVHVEGLAQRRLCTSRVRLGDSRVFLVDYTADPQRVRLNSSLVPVTLRNLHKIRAYTRGRNVDLWPFTLRWPFSLLRCFSASEFIE